MKTPLLLLLRAYKLGVSPFLGQNCRFYPSCSDYAAEAIGRHGSWKGSLLAGKRLSKCHPWHAGGLDPVPELASASVAGVAGVAGLVSAVLPPDSLSDSPSPTVATGGCCSHS